jgi:histidine ammonia-lyase
MALEYTAQAAAAEVRLLAAAATAQHASVGGGLESHASFAPLAARHTDAALDRYADAVATELVLAARALGIADRTPRGAGSRVLWERIAGDRPGGPFTADVARARIVLERAPPAPAARPV